MNNDAALLLLLADRQREIEGLRSHVAALEEQLAQVLGALAGDGEEQHPEEPQPA